MNTRDSLVDGRIAWIVVAAQLGLIVMTMGSTYLLWVGLKPIAADFGWPREVPSLANSLQMIGTGLGGIVMGRWFDRVGLGPPVLTGTLAIVVGSLLLSRIDAAWQLHVINAVLIGFIGNGAMFAPLLTNTTRWFERRRGLAVAIVASGQGLAGAIWPPVFEDAIQGIGWRDASLYYGLACLLVMPPLILVIRRPAPVGHAAQESVARGTATAVAGLPLHVPHALLCFGILTCCIAMAVPLVHVVAHVSDLGYASKRGAQLLAFVMVLSFFSRIGIGVLADRVGAMPSILIGSALQASGLALFIVAEGEIALFLAALLFGLGFGGLIPCYAVAVRAFYPPEDTGWRVGVVFFAGSIGMAIGGWMAGAVFDRVGSYVPAFMLATGANLANLAILGFLASSARRAARQRFA
jgi:MFS family permease